MLPGACRPDPGGAHQDGGRAADAEGDQGTSYTPLLLMLFTM